MLIPNESIRHFININKGVVLTKRDKVSIFINRILIGAVRNHSIEEVFSCINSAASIKSVIVEEFNNNATLTIDLN